MAMMVDGQVVERVIASTPGRPYIGPKAQAAVEEMFHQYVRAEARSRGVPLSVIWREIIVQGAIERYNLNAGDA